MAWKIGKISHKKCTRDQIKYHGEWEMGQESLSAKIWKDDTLSKEYFSDIRKRMLEIEGEELEDYIEKLCGVKHLGPVYIITLRYFATKGEYPIYDKYAYRALQAISGQTIKVKDSPGFKEMYDIYKDYCEKIKKNFKDEYENRKKDPELWRKVDQALWVYGHNTDEILTGKLKELDW